jgi:hypothetical protein
MLRTNVVRRAGRLLGAVTVTGVLAAGLLTASPVPAQAGTSWEHTVHSHASGLAYGSRHLNSEYLDFANGI